MTLQQGVEFEQFVRCYCIGQEDVMIMPYDPSKPYLSGEQYLHNPNYLSAELAERISNDIRTLCRALGYDINTCEFAIQDGVPYAIDFMNPAPDADVHSVGEFYHNWVTNAVTDLVFRRLAEPRPQAQYRWDAFLRQSSAAESLQAVAVAAGQAARNIIPQPVLDIPSDIAEGVSSLVSDAADVVSGIIGSVTEPDDATAAKTAKRNATASGTTKRKTATKKSASPRTPKPTPEA
jgi:hypothetical protein